MVRSPTADVDVSEDEDTIPERYFPRATHATEHAHHVVDCTPYLQLVTQ